MTIDFKESNIDIENQQAKWIDIPSLNTDAEPLHFSAANGFPVLSYLEFFSLLSNNFNITTMDCRGVWGATHPLDFTMHGFADDLICALEKKHKQPVIGVGHSLGGFVTLLAAIERPDLFSKIILIEPASLPNRWIDSIYPYIPNSVLFNLFPFMKGSLLRQNQWQSKQDFYDRYRKHNTYKRFTETSFNNYMHAALIKKDNLFELQFSPNWEAHIFSIVEFIWKHLAKVTVPTMFIRAEHSNLYSQKQFTKHNKNLPNHITSIEIDDTYHLLPLEAPKISSKIITKLSTYDNI